MTLRRKNNFQNSIHLLYASRCVYFVCVCVRALLYRHTFILNSIFNIFIIIHFRSSVCKSINTRIYFWRRAFGAIYTLMTQTISARHARKLNPVRKRNDTVNGPNLKYGADNIGYSWQKSEFGMCKALWIISLLSMCVCKNMTNIKLNFIKT